MIKIIIFSILLIPSLCFAKGSGYLFLGKYLNYKAQDLENREISYYAGIYLEHETKGPTLFIREETLIRDIDNWGSYPKQVNYTLGLKQKVYNFEIILKHECLHPVDGISGGKKAESYNLIEGRYNF
jgi:hypothetical protein